MMIPCETCAHLIIEKRGWFCPATHSIIVPPMLCSQPWCGAICFAYKPLGEYEKIRA